MSLIENHENLDMTKLNPSYFSDPTYQYFIGNDLFNGIGCAKKVDKEQAIVWFNKAGQQGLARAQYKMGWCLLNGEGIKMNKEAAAIWLYYSAQQNHPDSQYLLGECYLNGYGVQQNYLVGNDLMFKAAMNGNINAHNRLFPTFMSV
jgi:TPR repeat protein